MIKQLSAKIDGRDLNDELEIIDAILDNRQINDIVSFLRPSEDDLIPFEKLKNIDKAYDIITKTVDNNGNFFVYFDQDNDGICAGTIATKYLEAMGANVKTYIGQGKAHGLESLPLDELKNIDTLIIVDSINDDIKLYETIINLGITVLICDHHIIPESLKNTDLDITLVSCMDDYPNPSLSGSAVVWKTMAYVDFMNLTNFADDLIDLAATGLVGDMMDLSNAENRYICHKGFCNLVNPALKQIVGGHMFNAESVLYSVSPLINSCMRTNNNNVAMQMFLEEDDNELKSLIKEAKQAKEQQKKMVDDVINSLMEQLDEQHDKKCKVFFIPSEYRTLSGLLGNRILSQVHSPLLVVHRTEDNKICGSMRAEGVLDFAAMINETGLAEAKGHELASGFECDEALFDRFLTSIEEQLKDIEFSTVTEADILLEPHQITETLIRQLLSINRISGSGFRPITVMVQTDNYTASFMSQGKHSKFIDNDSGLLLVSWNDETWRNAPTDKCLCGIGTVSKVHYGRNDFLQLTMNDYDFTQQND